MIIYGFFYTPYTSQTTLEKLSISFYGIPDHAELIAMYNRITNIDDLTPGQKIKIPIFEKQKTGKNNYIYAKKELRDNYGRDINLVDGKLKVSASGDIDTVSGVENLSQAILLRLKEDVSKRVRLTMYGIRTNISDSVAGNAYVAASVQGTILADPRVETLEDVEYYGEGDALVINAKYIDINKSDASVQGRV